MFYSLTGIIVQAKNEIDANNQVHNISQAMWDWKENRDSIKDAEAFGVMSVIETEDIDSFLKELQEVVNNFLKSQRERNECIE